MDTLNFLMQGFGVALTPTNLIVALIGTLIGTVPGVLLTTAFAHNLMLALHRPSQQTLGILLIVVLLLAGFAIGVRRLLQRQGDGQ